MSGLATRRGKVIGVTAATAVVLSTMSSAAVASTTQGPKPLGVTTSATAAEVVPSVCKITSYAPNKIVIGASKVTKTFSVKVTGCTLAYWSVVLWPFVDDAPLSTAGVAGTYWYWDTNAAGDDVKVQLRPKLTLSPKYLSNSYAGKLADAAYVKAWGEEDPTDDENVEVDLAWADLPLTLQRRASFGETFNASPEPVKKGKKISIKGTLSRVNWNGAKTLKYVGFAGKAKVQFKADGATSYKTVKTVTASSKGKVSTTVKATRSGRWRLVFPGLSTTATATSGSDAVKVN